MARREHGHRAIAAERNEALAPARMHEHTASDKPVAAAISRSKNSSSFGATSRLNHASSILSSECFGPPQGDALSRRPTTEQPLPPSLPGVY